MGPQLARWLDALDANGRWALLKLLGGAPRVGVSARLAKTALAEWAAAAGTAATLDDIEEVWHGLAPPYPELFAWLSGKAGRPDISGRAGVPAADAGACAGGGRPRRARRRRSLRVEWKWDGIRVQIASARGATRLYSRTGEDIGAAFPDIAEGWRAEGVFDGELLVVREGAGGAVRRPAEAAQPQVGQRSPDGESCRRTCGSTMP